MRMNFTGSHLQRGAFAIAATTLHIEEFALVVLNVIVTPTYDLVEQVAKQAQLYSKIVTKKFVGR